MLIVVDPNEYTSEYGAHHSDNMHVPVELTCIQDFRQPESAKF